MTTPHHVTGNDVRELRRILGISQDAAAGVLSVAPRTLVNWEGADEAPLPTRARSRFAVAAASALVNAEALGRASDELLNRLASELGPRQGSPIEGPLFDMLVNEIGGREFVADGGVPYELDTVWRAERLALLPSLTAAVELIENLEDKTGSRTIHSLVGTLLAAISEAQLFSAVSNHEGRLAEPFVAAIGRLQAVAERAIAERTPAPRQGLTFMVPSYDHPQFAITPTEDDPGESSSRTEG